MLVKLHPQTNTMDKYSGPERRNGSEITFDIHEPGLVSKITKHIGRYYIFSMPDERFDGTRFFLSQEIRPSGLEPKGELQVANNNSVYIYMDRRNK